MDKNIAFHVVIAWAIVFWSIVHIAAHLFNYLAVEENFPSVSAGFLNLQSGPGLTGQIITISLFLIVTSAVEVVRRKNFEMFWFTHHLFLVFFGGLLMHGSFCFIKADFGDICRGGPKFWKYWIGSAICYLIERIYRVIRGRRLTHISKVIQHPSNVVEIQIQKPSFHSKAGQYIFICCPEISAFEWHPFTLTSSPQELFTSIHIRVVGDWTTRFTRRLGCQFSKTESISNFDTLPYIMIDGPYGTASEDVFNYKAALLVGAGIGVTPFASILKTIWYQINHPNRVIPLQKVYFVWICKDKQV